MQDIVTNMRGTHAFDSKAGKLIPLALAAGALGLTIIAPTQAAPKSRPLQVASLGPLPALSAARHVVKGLTLESGTPADVTLDFVGADINDVLKALSLQTHTNIVSGSDVKGNVTVSLAHVSLDEALNMISHLSGFQYAKLGNSYVVGSQASITTLTAGIAAAPRTAVVAFNYSDPTQLAQIITDRYPSVKVTQGKAAGTNSRGGVMIVTGSDSDVGSVRQLVADTEQGLSHDISSANTVIYNIKYAAADDLETVLGRLVPNLIVTPGPSQRTPPIAPSTADAGGVTSTTTSYGATPGGGATVTSVTGNLPTKLTTSSLLLTGADADIARAQQILATVDLRPSQINFEAKITDLNVDLTRQLGLSYDFANAQTTVGELLQPGDTPTSTVFKQPYPGNILRGQTFGRSPLAQFVTIGLKAAQSKGDARLLASPNISAIDGQPAAIFIGDNVTYVSSITASTTGENVTTNTISAGIKLFITGKVNNDGYITVNLHPEVSTYTLTAAAGGTELPDISTREATTTLRVRDGDIIALGGLAQNQESKTSNQVPLLADIPILGNLFRWDTKQRTRRELVIFIKVSIQKDAA